MMKKNTVWPSPRFPACEHSRRPVNAGQVQGHGGCRIKKQLTPGFTFSSDHVRVSLRTLSSVFKAETWRDPLCFTIASRTCAPRTGGSLAACTDPLRVGVSGEETDRVLWPLTFTFNHVLFSQRTQQKSNTLEHTDNYGQEKTPPKAPH